MTQKTQPRVYIKYAHPRESSPISGDCGMFSWISLAEYASESPGVLIPQDRFDRLCPRCGIEGSPDGQMTERVDGEPSGRFSFPAEINPEDVPAGYPLLITNQGYRLTS